MVKKALLLLSAIVCMAGNIYAQLTCATDQVYWDLVNKHPEIAQMQEKFNEQIRQQLNNNFGRYAKKTAGQEDTIINIPLVVHIIHNYGSENISDNDIYTAAQYWTKVFMLQNDDTDQVIKPFKKYIGNPRIHVQLATRDPLGRPTKGVTRHFSYLTSQAGDQSKLDQWPPDQYVNVWFVKLFSQQNEGAAAYAYPPATANVLPFYDGVICLYNYINTQKTIPHEIGHVFNLMHTWGNTNNPEVACGDDEVFDTPPTKGHKPESNGGGAYCNPNNFDTRSPLWDKTCAEGYFKLFSYPLSSVPGVDSLEDYPDTVNSQNIMDYTYCEVMFTKLQVERMRIALRGIGSQLANRIKLSDSTNLVATGVKDANGNYIQMPDLPPVADFSIDKATASSFIDPNSRGHFLCAGITTTNPLSFTFSNQSWNDTVSSVQWTFSNGAKVASSTSMTSVVNQFATPGWVNVSLIARSNAGSDTITREHAVYAADGDHPVSSNYVAEFNKDDRDKFPIFNYYDNNFKWEFVDNAGFYDQTAIRYTGFDTRQAPDVYIGKPTGDFDDFFTPAFDLSGIAPSTQCYFTFLSAGAYKTSLVADMNDTLEVAYSNNCGQNWTNFTPVIARQDLGNNGNVVTPFTPTVMTDWKTRSMAIPSGVRGTKVFFRFRYKPGSNSGEISTGNNFYIDRINVSTFALGLNTPNAEKGIAVAPNPTKSNAFVLVKGYNGAANILVTDLTGKVVYRTQSQLNNSATSIEIPAAAISVKGMYLVQVITDEETHTEKLVVY